ncbi:MAG TPA: TetR/AcrR family transcriptional regulator [Oculatellaceae cyanobacterium]
MARKIDPAKRTSILTAGRTILLRDGYGAAKMSDIAAEAGVAPGTLYLYFESKEALASAIGEDFFGRLGENFIHLIKQLNDPSGIDSLVDFSLRIGKEERDLLALLKRSMPEPRCEQTSPRTLFRNQVAIVLQELMKKQYVRHYEPQSLADVMLSILHGLMISCVFSENGQTDELKASAVKVLQHALFEDVIVS